MKQHNNNIMVHMDCAKCHLYIVLAMMSLVNDILHITSGEIIINNCKIVGVSTWRLTAIPSICCIIALWEQLSPCSTRKHV